VLIDISVTIWDFMQNQGFFLEKILVMEIKRWFMVFMVSN